VREQLLAKLAVHSQQHLIAFWDELGAADRRRLAAQIDAVDFAQIDRLFRQGTNHEDWETLASRASPPAAIRLGGHDRADDSHAGRQAGAAALAAGKVGTLLVAGGQGSRLGFPHPKGMFPIGPVSHASLFQIHFEKVLATRRRYGAPVPVYLMTSPANHGETIAYLQQQNYFGLPAEEVVVFCQAAMPAVDAGTGKLLLADRGRLFLSPDGHGGVVAALRASGAADDVRARKLECLFYLQVDNPLAPVCDPELIGAHLRAGSELTTLVVAKQTPWDRVGNVVSIDGQLRIIEYIDLPDAAAVRRTPAGSLTFWAGSIAIHLFSAAFLERVIGQDESLPFHVSKKRVPHIDGRAQPVEPAAPNALKFERFVFDLLPAARHAIAIEVDRHRVFAPLKNATGADSDSPEWVHQQMVRLHRGWLEAAGATVAGDVAVEISPLWALDGDQLTARIEPGLHVTEATYFRD